MHQKRIFIGAFIATSCMTAYSYVVSARQRKNFREPALLAAVIRRSGLVSSSPVCKILGWKIHYVIGLLFAELYTSVWNNRYPATAAKDGLVAGGLTGVAAILVWRFTLKIHPSPPPVAFAAFAGQLLIAHILFGVVYAWYMHEQKRQTAPLVVE